jgi:TatD DNase family protein
MLIDSHTHLEMPPFRDDLDEVIGRAVSSGVGEMLNVGSDPSSFDETLALTEQYKEVYGALGIHPHSAKDWNGSIEKKLKRLILRRKALAVGEIGLDYYRDLSPREVQQEVFRRQIGIALYFKKPIIVHCRDAFRDVITILKEEGAREVGGVFHAFSGGDDEALEVVALGFHIGIGGPITYRNSKLPQVAQRLPSGSMVLETDCPYLPPEPYRGKRNEPSYVKLVAEKLTETLGVQQEDIERATEVNYRYLFHGKRDFPQTIAYALKGNLYVNVTSSCTNNCAFCARSRAHHFIYGYNLNLITDPTVEEMISAVRGAIASDTYREIVFCGYGEPTCRHDDIVKAATALKELGVPLRLNTNGHGNMINRRNIVLELDKVFDRISISLNAHDKDTYMRLCRPDAGAKAYDAMLDFIRKAAASQMECTVTTLDCPEIDVEASRGLVETIPGAAFRVRRYHFTSCTE